MSIEKNEFTNADYSKDYIINGLQAMPGGFFIYKADWNDEKILYANQALLDLFECDTDEEFKELTGGTFKGLVHPDDYEEVEASIRMQVNASDDQFDQVHYRIMTKTGKIINIEDIARLYEDPVEGPLFYVFVSTFQPKVDILTGLPNRTYFLKVAEEACQQIYLQELEPVVIAFDFNGMKTFNSRYGMDEGDKFILNFTDILKKHFERKNCSRFGEDHFYVYTAAEGIEVVLNQIISELHSANSGRTLSVRIGIAHYMPTLSISEICDRAKIASDTLNGSMESDYVWFDESITQEQLSREYILHHVDQAIAEGWIEPYYQPIVRTMTGRVCGFEALARWRDPKYGLISPAEFIPILEENGVAYKLDMYIVGRIVGMIQHRIDEGKPVVPVSFNISRSDFDSCDPVTVISSACDSRGVSRNLICVEITETVLMSDRGLIRNAINRFHEAGFEVWMDDFGAGYSSLNVLKDFDFNQIKIDMGFLQDLNDKSKQIVTMAVRMAKSLGIHTLAEGVETKEHYDFLYKIGCERIQGYYCGKPMPLDIAIDHIKETGIIFETKESYAFYQKVGLLDLVSDKPLAVFFYDGKKFSTVFKNELYSYEISNLEITDDQAIELNMNSNISVLSNKFKKLADKAVQNNNTESMLFVARNRYFKFSFTPIAIARQGIMLSATIDGTEYDAQRRAEEMDNIIRNITSAFDCIYLVDVDKDTSTVVTTIFPSEYEGEVTVGVDNYYSSLIERKCYVDDLDRMSGFLNNNIIEERFKASEKGSFSEVFNILQPNGEYQWTEFLFIILPESEGHKYFMCLRPAEIEDIEDKTEFIRKNLEANNVIINGESDNRSDDWTRSFLQSGNIKMFWKDRNRRFVGASRAFLDYYGFRSIDEILGKTDEDLAWHIDDTPYMTDEFHVIERGETVINAHGKVVVEGVPRDILANKFPAYHDGKIIGLIGYFVDIEQDIKSEEKITKGNLVDPLTGLLNAQGMMLTMLEFDNNLKSNGQDYNYIFIFINGYNEVLADYGDEIAQRLIKLVARIIKRSFKSTATIARTYGCYFAICERGESTDTISKKVSKCAKEIKEIKEIEKCRCSINMTYGISMGSEAENVQTIMDIAHKRQEVSFRRRGIDLAFNNTEILPDIYSDLPLPYVVLRPVMDDAGETVLDMRFLFVNEKYCELTGIAKKDLLGRGYMETFPRTDHAWIDYTYRAVRGEYVHNRLYDGATRHWMQFTAAPSVVPGTCAVVYEVVDSEKKQENQVNAGKTTMVEMINLARILDSEIEYKNAINDALEYIGKVTGANRVYIFETDRKVFTNTFEWFDNGIGYGLNDHQFKDYKYITLWEKLLQNDTSIVIQNVQLLKFEYPDLYNYLRSRGISWLVSAPIYHKGKLIGYLGADNFDRDKDIDIRKFMETAAYFLSARLKLHELYEKDIRTSEERDKLDKEVSTRKIGQDIVSMFWKNEDATDVMQNVLQKLGELLNPDRLFIMEIEGDTITNTAEWCNTYVDSMMSKRQSLDSVSYLGMQYDMFYIRSMVIVEDVEDIKEHTINKYKLLKENGIDRFIEVPFFDQGKLIGIVGVDNYTHVVNVDTKRLLETVVFFIGYKIVINKLRVKSAQNNMALLQKSGKSRSRSKSKESDLVQYNAYNELSVPIICIKLLFNEDGSRADDFEFEYVNDAYCRLLSISRGDVIGKKYLDVFHDADPQWISDAYEASLTRKNIRDRRYIPAIDKWFDTLIAPESKTGYCSVILLDETNRHKEEAIVETKVQTNVISDVIIKVAETLSGEKDDDQAIKNILEELSKYVDADHIYILMIDHNKTTFSERYEWCKDGVRSNLGMLQRIDLTYLQRANSFRHGNYLCDDVSVVKDIDVVLYEFLTARNIRNTVQIPLHRGDEIIGYFGVDNVEKNSEEVLNMLTAVSYFVEARLIVAKMDM